MAKRLKPPRGPLRGHKPTAWRSFIRYSPILEVKLRRHLGLDFRQEVAGQLDSSSSHGLEGEAFSYLRCFASEYWSYDHCFWLQPDALEERG